MSERRRSGVVALASSMLALAVAVGCSAPARPTAPAGSPPSAAPAPEREAAPTSGQMGAAPMEAFDVTIGSAAATLNVVAVDVAVEQGFFAAEGLRVHHSIMKSDATIAGLVTGEVQFTGATGSLARAIPMGMPAKVVMFMVKAPNSAMYAQPGVQRVEELAGQPFGVNALVS